MELKKEEIAEKIIETLKAEGKKVNPAVVQQKNKWNKDQLEEIFVLFSVSTFNEVLESIPGVNLEKDSKATPSVWYEKTSVTPPILFPLRKFRQTAKFSKSRLNPILA